MRGAPADPRRPPHLPGVGSELSSQQGLGDRPVSGIKSAGPRLCMRPGVVGRQAAFPGSHPNRLADEGDESGSQVPPGTPPLTGGAGTN